MQRNFDLDNSLVAVVLDYPVLVSFVFHVTLLQPWAQLLEAWLALTSV